MKSRAQSEPHYVLSRRLAWLVASFIFAPLGLTAAEAQSGIPQALTIEHHSVVGGSGTFVASGAITDAGSVTLDSAHPTALPSPVVGTGHFIRTYHGKHGTFTIQLQTLLKPTDVLWLFTETGSWVITDADGDYEGLLGEGKESGVRDFSAQKLDAVLTGKVHFNATKASSRVTTNAAAAPTLTVTNGSGSGQHVAGTIVTVTADPPPQGKSFAGWTGDVQILANPSLSTTTATMPSVDVMLSATLR